MLRPYGCAVELSNLSVAILLVYFAPRDGQGPGEVHTYELSVEERGEGLFKVGSARRGLAAPKPRLGGGLLGWSACWCSANASPLPLTHQAHLEPGPTLNGEMHALHDMALDLVSTPSLGAWLLYEDGLGCRHVQCVPLDFTTDGSPIVGDLIWLVVAGSQQPAA